jgi:hypothetical protein
LTASDNRKKGFEPPAGPFVRVVPLLLIISFTWVSFSHQESGDPSESHFGLTAYQNIVVSPVHDLSNAYSMTSTDLKGGPRLFTAVEQLPRPETTLIEFEFKQHKKLRSTRFKRLDRDLSLAA